MTAEQDTGDRPQERTDIRAAVSELSVDGEAALFLELDGAVVKADEIGAEAVTITGDADRLVLTIKTEAGSMSVQTDRKQTAELIKAILDVIPLQP